MLALLALCAMVPGTFAAGCGPGMYSLVGARLTPS